MIDVWWLFIIRKDRGISSSLHIFITISKSQNPFLPNQEFCVASVWGVSEQTWGWGFAVKLLKRFWKILSKACKILVKTWDERTWEMFANLWGKMLPNPCQNVVQTWESNSQVLLRYSLKTCDGPATLLPQYNNDSSKLAEEALMKRCCIVRGFLVG